MHFVIVGCGSVGAGLANVLDEARHQVVVIDSDETAFRNLGRSFSGRTLCGVAFDRSVLVAAAIDKSDGLAALTSSDETNAVIARLAKEVFRVPKVVARLYDPRKAAIYATLGLQTISPVTWGINRIADLLLYTELHSIAALGSGEVDIMEVEVPLPLIGHMVKDLQVPGEIQVIAVTRQSKTFLPASEMSLREHDLLHVAVSATHVSRVRELLGFT